MEQLRIPEGYYSPLTIRETEVAIKEVKDHFERALARALHLTVHKNPDSLFHFLSPRSECFR